jgi:hypothetical protein
MTPTTPTPATGKAAAMSAGPVRAVFDDRPITAHAEYAYNPRQGARSVAREHAILDIPLRRSRIRRDAGDALCKPRRAFWGLSQGSTPEVSCPRCLELAERYGVTLPQKG